MAAPVVQLLLLEAQLPQLFLSVLFDLLVDLAHVILNVLLCNLVHGLQDLLVLVLHLALQLQHLVLYVLDRLLELPS